MIFFVLSLLISPVILSGTEDNIRIIGGQHARAGQFPFSAAIRIKTSDSSKFCGGALISNRWVLTAAHCLKNAVEIDITLGTTMLSENNSHTLILSSSTYYVYPEFDKDTLVNDIGLVEFRQSIQYSDYISKIHLPVTDYNSDVNVTAIGWGQTSDDTPLPEDYLNYVQMITISNIVCKHYYGQQISDSMICASGQYTEGICTGDSGSPLVYLLNYIHPIIVGVASFHSGHGCGSVEPSGFTRVFLYKDWILNITGSIVR